MKNLQEIAQWSSAMFFSIGQNIKQN